MTVAGTFLPIVIQCKEDLPVGECVEVRLVRLEVRHGARMSDGPRRLVVEPCEATPAKK